MLCASGVHRARPAFRVIPALRACLQEPHPHAAGLALPEARQLLLEREELMASAHL